MVTAPVILVVALEWGSENPVTTRGIRNTNQSFLLVCDEN
jgi:hypothetical protein